MKNKQEKTTIKDLTKLILSGEIPISDTKSAAVRELLHEMGLPPNEINMQAAIVAGQALSGVSGNQQSAKFVLGLIGEDGEAAAAPTAEWYGLPANRIAKPFTDINRHIDNRKYVRYDFKGGRGAGRSSFCSLKMVDLIMANPHFCGLIIRAVKDTMRDTVYSQMLWAIDELGLSSEFSCTTSPLQIVRQSTGQIIYFRGADDPGKVKSIKPPRGTHVGVVWAEEADQIPGGEFWRSILQSAFRGGNDGIVMRSYNTPISHEHYINKELLVPDPKRAVLHSFYYDMPQEWLGSAFLELAAHTKATNERAYRHEYLGEPIGTGSNVFENIQSVTITDEQIATFDRIVNGVDWGFFPDPWAFVRCYFHSGSQTLYIFDEAIATKAGNEATADILRQKGLGASDRIIADSAEPKSIADYKKLGLRLTQGARKGQGSVEYSMKWLASLRGIVIDPVRCPNTFREFVAYELAKDKYGEIISGFPDKDNHFIDCVRYACEEYWVGRGFVVG